MPPVKESGEGDLSRSQDLPNCAFALPTQASFAVPASASHFSDCHLVLCVTLLCVRFLGGVSLLRRRVLARVGHDTVDLGIGLGLDQRGVCFLHADVLGIARKLVTFLLGDIEGRFGTGGTRFLACLRRVVIRDFRIRLGDLFLAGGFRETNVPGVAASR